MARRCDYCGRPATWHGAWQMATMPAPTFPYACDDHRQRGMVPIDQRLDGTSYAIPARGDVGEIEDEDDYEGDVEDEDDEREIDDEDDEE
jgi:hypothetical protein